MVFRGESCLPVENIRKASSLVGLLCEFTSDLFLLQDASRRLRSTAPLAPENSETRRKIALVLRFIS